MPELDMELTLPEDFIQGFNDGYLVAEHMPQLADQLQGLEASSERMAGLKGGIRQYGLEKEKELFLQRFRSDMDKSYDDMQEPRTPTQDKDEITPDKE